MKRLSLLIAAIAFAVCSSAQLSIWDGTDDVWTKGAGTESSPYLIESAQQLAFIASMVNGGVTTYENTYFKLMTNIDLNNLTWVPIGSSATKCFKGHIDGNNHNIHNVTNSLFGYCTSGEVSRFYVESNQFITNANNCSFYHCFYNGQQAMFNNTTECIIYDCHAYVINGTRAALVNKATNCQIIKCQTAGNIKTIINSNYSHDVYKDMSDVTTRGEFSSIMCTGGLVCVSKNNTYMQCQSNCLTTTISNIQSQNMNYMYTNISAGLIATSMGDAIHSCSNIASSSAYFPVLSPYKSGGNTYYSNGWEYKESGIIGLNTLGRSEIKNSYTTNDELFVNGGCITATTTTTTYRSLSPTISNSYTSLDKTEQAMKSASFPIVLNTDSTVFIQDITPNVNDGYPIYVDQVYSVTDALSTIGFTTAQLLGHYYALNADSVGFEYKEKNDNTHWYKSVTGQASGNIISYDLSDLSVGTNYVYRVWVERGGVRYFGDILSFKTLECSKTITPLAASICQGEEYAFNGQQLTQSGSYRDTLVASNGCDSIIELTLTVMPYVNIDKYDTIMVGESYDFYGEILTESGTYEHYVPMVNRCNLIILHLYVRQPDVTLTVNVNDPLTGSAEGSGSFEKYTERTIKAVPNEGYHFVQWNDGNTDNPRTIYLTQDTTFTAQFAINQYTISVTCNPQQGSIEGEGGTFNHGTELTYKANANEGYHFVQWSDGVINNPRTIVLTQETNLSAVFALNTYTLSVTCNVDQGYVNGTSGVFEHGTSHNFEAIPNTGFHFIQWSDEVVDNPRTIILTQDSILSAEFAKNKYLVQFFGFNDALLDSQSIEHGTAAVAPEVPIIDHYDFVGWDKEFTNVTSDLDVFAIYQENTEAIENVDVSIYPKKIMIDGQIYILRGEKTYTFTGQEVK